MSKFSEKVDRKSLFELKEIVQNEKEYVPEMVLAAIEELEKRDGISKEVKEEYLLKEESKREEKLSRKIKEAPFIPKDLPQKIVSAAILIYVSGALSFVTGLIYFTGTFNLNGILLAGLGLMIHRGKEGGKWVLTVLCVLGILLMIFSFIYSVANGISYTFSYLGILHTVLQLSAVILLFSQESIKWYKTQKGEQIEEDEFIFRD